jgi:cell division topological specificity factor minE
MSIFSYLFGKKENSAAIAKDRLQIIIAQERVRSQAPDYLPMLQKELMDVLAKYVHISLEDIKIQQDKKDGVDVLELNITLPEKERLKNPTPHQEIEEMQ